MDNTSKYIVAIDPGTTKVVGIIGKKNGDSMVDILALAEKSLRKGSVHRGQMHNVSDVAAVTEDVISELLKKAGLENYSIKSANTSLNNYNVRTLQATVTLNLPGDVKVTDADLYSLKDDALEKIPEKYEVIHIQPQEYLSDGIVDINPDGTMPRCLEGRYKVICCLKDVMRSFETCFGKDFKNNIFIGSVAGAAASLRLEEKNKGVVYIDFGAGTTSLCIYKDNILRYVAVLPFGGNNITEDLKDYYNDENIAEKEKVVKGNAIHYTAGRSFDEMKELSEEYKKTNDIIVARIEEIVSNIWAQIKYSGIQNLAGGIVIGGRGSSLTGLDRLLEEKTKLNVRHANPVEKISFKTDGIVLDEGHMTGIGLILLGDTDIDYIEEIKKKVQENPEQPTIFEEDIPYEKKEKEKVSYTKTNSPQKHKKKSILKDIGKSFGGFLFGDEN